MTDFHLSNFIPDLLSVACLAGFLFYSILTGSRTNQKTFSVLAIGASILGAALYLCRHHAGSGFAGMLSAGAFALYFKVFFTAVFFVTAFMCREFFKNSEPKQQEFGLVLWCALIGLYFLASATHALIFFIALEILTMALYIMVSYVRHDAASVEAGLKYLILGSIASGFIIFGIALLYMQTGTLSFSEITAFRPILFGSRMGLLALLFIFSGLGFKVAVFPAQLWVPDVYQGAPTPVTAFLSTASKAAGFLLLIRFFTLTVGPLDPRWKIALCVLALLTLLYGNLGALGQTGFKRLMGYSSIAHAGYLMMGFVSGTTGGTSSVLYYLAGYASATLTVFYVILLIEKNSGSDEIRNFEGLSQTSPLLGSVLFVALLSLAGIPPLAGFMGKFWILFSALQVGFDWLVYGGLAMVVVGIYYYFSVALKLFFRKPVLKTTLTVPLSAKFILMALTLLTIGIGLFQAPLLRLAATAVLSK